MEVADSIVVMADGKVEQVGSPDELYDQPANDFVMSFLGPVTELDGRLVRPHDLELSTAAAAGHRRRDGRPGRPAGLRGARRPRGRRRASSGPRSRGARPSSSAWSTARPCSYAGQHPCGPRPPSPRPGRSRGGRGGEGCPRGRSRHRQAVEHPRAAAVQTGLHHVVPARCSRTPTGTRPGGRPATSRSGGRCAAPRSDRARAAGRPGRTGPSCGGPGCPGDRHSRRPRRRAVRRPSRRRASRRWPARRRPGRSQDPGHRRGARRGRWCRSASR